MATGNDATIARRVTVGVDTHGKIHVGAIADQLSREADALEAAVADGPFVILSH